MKSTYQVAKAFLSQVFGKSCNKQKNVQNSPPNCKILASMDTGDKQRRFLIEHKPKKEGEIS